MFTNIDAHAGLGDDECHVEEEQDDLHADEQTDGRLGTLHVLAEHQPRVPRGQNRDGQRARRDDVRQTERRLHSQGPGARGEGGSELNNNNRIFAFFCFNPPPSTLSFLEKYCENIKMKRLRTKLRTFYLFSG